MGLTWQGIDDVLAGLSRIEDRVQAAVPGAVKAGGDVISDASAALVPKDTLELEQSRRVRPDGDHTVAIEYNAFYARWQHERLDYHHPNGQAKFLEQAVRHPDAAVQEVSDRIGQAL